jgi:hypothetical protein
VAKISELIKILRGEGDVAAVRRAERIGDEAPYAAERIDAETLRSVISRGDNANSLAIIKPEDFRYLAQQFHPDYLNMVETPKIEAPAGMSVQDYIRHLGGVAKEQGFRDIPFLDYGEHAGSSRLGVTGHEGRHRMRALEGLGDEKALVRLFPRASVREPLPRRSRSEFLEALAEKYGVPMKLDPEGYESTMFDVSRPVQPFGAGGLAKFFSAVDEAVANLRQKKGTGEQMLKQIQQSPGVKKEELDLRKLPEKLAGQQKVTQEDIQAMLKAVPAPKLELTTRGGKPQHLPAPDLDKWIAQDSYRQETAKALNRLGYEPVQNPDNPNMLGFMGDEGDILDAQDLAIEFRNASSALLENLLTARRKLSKLQSELGFDPFNEGREPLVGEAVDAVKAEMVRLREELREINSTIDDYQDIRDGLVDFHVGWRQVTEKGTEPAKFSEYQTKGPSENYRELLIRLGPEEKKVIERPPFEYGRQGLGGDPEELAPEEALRRLGLTDMDELGGGDNVESVLYYPSSMYITKGSDGRYYTLSNSDDIVTENLAEAEDWLSREMEPELRAPIYEPSTNVGRPFVQEAHFPEPDIVVHTRVSDRTGPNGEKILYVDEIQSDWHQKARGTVKDVAERIVGSETVANEIANAARRQVKVELGLDPNAELPLFLPTSATNVELRFKEVQEQLKKQRIALEIKMMPKDFGYKQMGTRTPPWSQTSHELAVKQLLDTAANEGYDKVVFAPGSEQVRRYSLGEYFNRIEVVPEPEGSYKVRAEHKDGRKQLIDNMSAKGLADAIGEDKAAKAIADIEGGQQTATFEGEDLLLGTSKAQGKLKIYDEIIPQYLSKYAGKEFNVQPGRTAIPVEDIEDAIGSYEYTKRDQILEDLADKFERGGLDEDLDFELREMLENASRKQAQREIFSPGYGDTPYNRFMERFAKSQNPNAVNITGDVEHLVSQLEPSSFGRGTGMIANIIPEKILFKDPAKQAEYEQFLEEEWLGTTLSARTRQELLGSRLLKEAEDRVLKMTPDELYADMPPLKSVEGASIDITPEMRESIKTRGQPLFAVPPAVGAAAVLSDEEEPVASYETGGRVEELSFQRWIRGTPWFKEYVQEHGEEPNLDIEEYDYRAAWKAGVTPQRDPYDKNRYHWPSVTSEGKALKSKDHPTAWKEKYMQEFGVNPDAIGAEKPEGYKEAGRVEKKKGMQQEQFDPPFDESRRMGPKPGVSAGPSKIRDLTKILRGENTEAKNLERQRIEGNLAAAGGLREYMYDMLVPQTGWEWAAEAAFFPVPRPVRKGLLAAAGAMYDPEAEAGKLSLLHGSPSKITNLQPGKDLWATTDPEYALKRAMDKMRIAEGAKGPGMVNRFEIEDTDLMRLTDKYSPEDIAIARRAFSKLPEGREMTGEEIYEIASTNTGGAKTAALEGVTRALGKKGYQVPPGADDKGEWYRVLDQTNLTPYGKGGIVDAIKSAMKMTETAPDPSRRQAIGLREQITQPGAMTTVETEVSASDLDTLQQAMGNVGKAILNEPVSRREVLKRGALSTASNLIPGGGVLQQLAKEAVPQALKAATSAPSKEALTTMLAKSIGQRVAKIPEADLEDVIDNYPMIQELEPIAYFGDLRYDEDALDSLYGAIGLRTQNLAEELKIPQEKLYELFGTRKVDKKDVPIYSIEELVQPFGDMSEQYRFILEDGRPKEAVRDTSLLDNWNKWARAAIKETLTENREDELEFVQQVQEKMFDRFLSEELANAGLSTGKLRNPMIDALAEELRVKEKAREVFNLALGDKYISSWGSELNNRAIQAFNSGKLGRFTTSFDFDD